MYYGSTALEENGVGFTLKQFNSKQLKLVHFANNYKETDKMTFLKLNIEIIWQNIHKNIFKNKILFL